MENIESVKKLQSLAKDVSILFVEDSKALQKQVGKFLEKMFREVYVANDGEEGIQKYKQNNPDLILTDLTMPKMNGHEMIRAIKKIDPDVEVIILSAHSDTETLMKSLHIGVSDFIPKPANASKMIGVFLKVLSNMKRKESTSPAVIEKEEEHDDEDVLNFIFKNSVDVDMVNHYKGVPIINSGKILKIDSDIITIKTTYLQLLAIKHEQGVVLDSSLISENILCKLISLDLDNYQVSLEKMDIFHPESKDRSELKLEVDKAFSMQLLDDERKIGTQVLYISKNKLAFETSSDCTFKKYQELKLEVTFPPLKNLSNTIVDKYNVIASVYKVDSSNDKQKVTVLLKTDEILDEVIQKYIYNREIDLIDEFKEVYHY